MTKQQRIEEFNRDCRYFQIKDDLPGIDIKQLIYVGQDAMKDFIQILTEAKQIMEMKEDETK